MLCLKIKVKKIHTTTYTYTNAIYSLNVSRLISEMLLLLRYQTNKVLHILLALFLHTTHVICYPINPKMSVPFFLLKKNIYTHENIIQNQTFLKIIDSFIDRHLEKMYKI